MEVSLIKKGFQRLADGDIVIRVSSDDYDFLIFMLGYKTAEVSKDKHDKEDRDSFLTKALELLNRINDGNPQYVPYKTTRGESSGSIPGSTDPTQTKED